MKWYNSYGTLMMRERKRKRTIGRLLAEEGRFSGLSHQGGRSKLFK